MSQELIDAIRVLRIELAIANERVAAVAGLNSRDLDILDVIDREGPCTPSHLADRTGLRPATLTGVLARLERDRWIARAEDPGDRRSALVSSTARFDELRALYRGGDEAVQRLAATQGPATREALRGFLAEVADEVRAAARGLGDE